MGNTTLAWQLRGATNLLKEEYRLNVLIVYILHGNERNRAWPSIETLINETGASRTVVISAKKWLMDCGALEYVELDKRIDKEAELHHRADVLQITGVLRIGDTEYPVLHFNEYQSADVYSTPTKRKAADTEGIEVYTDHDQAFNTSVVSSDPDSDSETTTDKASPTTDLQMLELARAEARNPFAIWEDDGFGALTPFTSDRLGDWIDTYGEESVKVALLSALMNDVRKPSYIDATLKRMFGEHTSREVREEVARKKGWEQAAEQSERDEELRASLYAPSARESSGPVVLMGNGKNPHVVWEMSYGQLQLSTPKEAFDTWVFGTKLMAFEDVNGVAVFTLGARHVQALAWLEHRLRKPILRTLSQVAGCAVVVKFVLASEYVSESEQSS